MSRATRACRLRHLICASCGAAFVAQRADRTYCSKRCQPSTRNRVQPTKTRRSFAGTCAACGAAWEGRKRKYCTVACGQAFMRRVHRLVDRARRRGAQTEVVVPSMVFERDRGTCQLCGEPVASETTTGPRSASIDHITPISRGGKHSYANVQLAHLVCNMRKGARAA